MQEKLPEIKDFPHDFKLTVFGRGSILGEEDVFSRDNYTCTLKCVSWKGTLYELTKDRFKVLQKSELSWLTVL